MLKQTLLQDQPVSRGLQNESWNQVFRITSGLTIPSVLFGTTGACQKCRLSGPAPDLLNQNLHFDKIPKRSGCPVEFEKHCKEWALFLLVLDPFPLLLVKVILLSWGESSPQPPALCASVGLICFPDPRGGVGTSPGQSERPWDVAGTAGKESSLRVAFIQPSKGSLEVVPPSWSLLWRL